MPRTPIVILLGLFLVAAPSLSIAQRTPGGGADGGASTPGGPGRRTARTSRRVIQGQVVSDGTRRIDYPIAVNLETLGITRDTVYTDGNGNFVFDQLGGGGGFDVFVDAPGFKPERVDVTTGPGSMGIAVIILESLGADEDSPGDPTAIDLSELLADIPDEAVELFEQAGEESEKGNHERASERLEEAIEIAPDFYQAQNALGVEYDRLGRKDDAIRHFLIARNLSPNSAAPVVSLGSIYLREHDIHGGERRLEEARASLDQAITYLEDAVERDPQSEFAQYYLGAAHYKAGAMDDALERLSRALGLNMQFHDARILLFNVYLAQRDYEAALDQLTTYLELYPDSPQREAIEQAKSDMERRLGQ
jgi:tetratricopeptide (TPR) repeat protein